MASLEERIQQLNAQRSQMQQQQLGRETTDQKLQRLNQELAEEGLRQNLESQGISPPAGFSRDQPLLLSLDKPNADQFLAAQLGQRQLGQERLDFGERFDLQQGLTFEDQQKKFLEKYPLQPGEAPEDRLRLVTIPPDLQTSEAGTSVLMFRRGPTSPWSRFDPIELETGDIADFSSSAGATGGELLGAAVTNRKAFLVRLFGVTAGALLGEATQRGVERFRGFTALSPEEEAANLAIVTASAALGNAIGDTIGQGIRIIMRGGTPPTRAATASALEADRIIGELNRGLPKNQQIPRLLAGQMSANPIAQRAYNQLLHQADLVSHKVAKQFTVLGDRLRQRVNPASLGDLKANISQAEGQLRQAALSMIKLPGTTLEDTGSMFVDLLQKWDDVAIERVNSLFATARTYIPGDIQFDMRALKDFASEELTRREADIAAGRSIGMGQDTFSILQQLATGEDVLTKTIIPDPRTGRLVVTTAEDAIRRTQLQLWQIAHPVEGGPIGRTTTEQQLARVLLNKTNASLAAPIVPDSPQSKAFASAWGEAIKADTARFANIEQLDFLIPFKVRQYNPAMAVKKLFEVQNPDTVTLVHRILQEQGLGDRWVSMQLGFKSQLLATAMTRGPEAALASIAGFMKSPKALELLLPVRERAGLQKTFQALVDLKTMGFSDSLASQQSNTKLVLDMVASGDYKKVAEILRVNGTGTPLRESIRNGLLDWLYNVSVETFKGPGALKGLQGINGIKLADNLAKLDESGAIKFLSPEDIDVVGKIAKVTQVIAPPGDIAASLAAGRQGGRVLSWAFGGLVHTLAKMGILGQFITSKAGRAYLIGLDPNQAADPIMLRTMGAALTEIGAKERIRQQQQLSGPKQ